MKNLLILSLFLSLNFCLAQPQWKFHIAFEDATSAKDTIWLIWDTTATISGVNVTLGEGPVNLNYNEFNVFTLNMNGDTTKTVARPYYNPYPFLYGILGISVLAINFQYPIIIRWDSSMFNASYLPPPEYRVTMARIDNEYFFGVNNTGYDHFSMLMDNTAYAPAFWWGSQSQFPMTFNLSLHPLVGMNTIYKENEIKLFPNPVRDILTIEWEILDLNTLEIINNEGKTLKKYNVKNQNKVYLEKSEFTSGLYLLRLIGNNGISNFKKIIIR